MLRLKHKIRYARTKWHRVKALGGQNPVRCQKVARAAMRNMMRKRCITAKTGWKRGMM